MSLLPDLFIGHGEGLTERLGRVQPDRRVLLRRRGCLSRDGSGAHVEGTRDGRQQSLIARVQANTCGGGTLTRSASKIRRTGGGGGGGCCVLSTDSVGLSVGPSFVEHPRRHPMIANLSTSSPKRAAKTQWQRERERERKMNAKNVLRSTEITFI